MIGLGQGMTYIPQESKVIYQSKDGKEEKAFDALEWLAAMCSHPPALPDQLPMLMELRSDGDKLIRVSNTGQPWRAGVPNKGEQTRLPCPIEPFFRILDKRISDDRKKQHG